MTIAVITPWLDHLELVDDYLEAIVAGNPDQLVVVDNGSTPPIDFAAVRIERNNGFSKACNVGLRHATTDKVLFLNNDIAMVRPDWLTRISEAIESGYLVGANLRFDNHTRVTGVPQRLPYLDGWCLGGMRQELLGLKGFDEEYLEPAYYSDNDLCLRARAIGMRLREMRGGLAHKVAQTSGWSAGANPKTQAVVVANYQRYCDKARALLAPVAA